ncbi:GroES-like protein [Schizophyllum commune H4-8]|uniref:Enoyl reductase (ER) domain-containing protein n=1 Tax=Schizophyllum commune (strain H4-8 / FGSC 9210) TaxID=578458 RepID=D8QJQ9_SCHCM|nr:GroES-like protein [Schizophyllum commune H4-8]KAI5885513.1 GroES-like protein [Schizophyllum commune H4-8]
MSMTVKAYGVTGFNEPVKPVTIQRRAPDANDVVIDIKYTGICHSDIHITRGEWGPFPFPLVIGHEIAGVVRSVGKNVTKFKVGQHVGVGCLLNSCRSCESCKDGEEQHCTGDGKINGGVQTYGGQDPKENFAPTAGGYSQMIVVDQDFVLNIPESLPLDKVAPLLCAGITMYSPLRHWKAGPGKRVAIIGLGGLGHAGVKIARALGAEVTVLSQSLSKKEQGLKLGADKYFATADPETFTTLKGHFDLIINTVSANLDLNQYTSLLRRNGSLVEVGIPEHPMSVHAFSLVAGRRSLAGSCIGGIKETQEMLDFCAEHGITAEIETIPASYINKAWERVGKSDVRFRFVIDISTI